MNYGRIRVLYAPEGGNGGGGGDGGDGGNGGNGGNGGKTTNVSEGDPGWYGQYNDGSRAALREAGIKDPNELVTSFASLRKEAGKDRMARPGPDATPEQQVAYRKFIGAGDDDKAYAFEDIDTKGVNPDFMGAIRGSMAKHGVPLDSAKGLLADVFGWTAQQRAKDLETAGNELKQEQDQLKATWGGSYQQNEALVYRAGEALGLSKEDIARAGGALGYGKIMNTLLKAGQVMREGRRLPGGEGLPNVDGDSYESAVAWLEKAESDPDMRRKLRAGDKALSQEHQRMVKIKAGGPKG